MNLYPILLTLGGISLISCDSSPQKAVKTRVEPHEVAVQPKVVAPATSATAAPAARILRSETDTLRFRNGSIAQLIPAREAEFARLKGIDTDTTEQKYIQLAEGRAQRRSDALLLTLTNGRTLTLTNNITDPDEEKHVVYRFRGPLENSDFWVLDVTRWESGFVLLINQHTGRRTRLWGRPVLAPNGTHLVTSNSDMEAHYSPNGLQVWSLEKGIPLLRWNRVVNTWGPEEVRWLNDQTLVIRQYYPDSTPQIKYARLLLPK
ncbi:hypothetical protein SAMN00120144_1539 [Hymenobacter roseosalivarius DSM 11622]|uniref:Uncharacterized protein n=1 Tax=Hymenobacter roseosalivarius DSM 11622 TaxID=645990 RepID=A0A1W1V1X6_9BACT|nr:hypothetical protein [Hymenobacter roseosalivarius]SMB87323.1 hypothetical protein SAMN00120144_1539 [Hymenobacter roseosalivarius DSM 11622]